MSKRDLIEVKVKVRADLWRRLQDLAEREGGEIESFLNPGIAHVLNAFEKHRRMAPLGR